jgi:hypothetical protein
MRRYTYREATPPPKDEFPGINPYPRLLMICGVTLLAYGIITPAGTVFRNVVQGLHTPSATAASTNIPSTTAAAIVVKPKVATLGEGSMTRTRKPGSVVNEMKTGAAGPFEQKNRKEILKLYTQWKDAWTRHDINAMMKLYSLRLDFLFDSSRFGGSGIPLRDYDGRRSSFLMIWRFGASRVTDVEAPSVTFDGKRAILLVGQRSQMVGGNLPARLRTMRYTLEREAITGSGAMQGSRPSAQNASAPSQTYTWRIIREERLEYQGSSDVESQVF